MNLYSVLETLQSSGFSVTMLWHVDENFPERVWRVRISDTSERPEKFWLGMSEDLGDAVSEAVKARQLR